MKFHLQAHQDSVCAKFTEVLKLYRELKIPTAPAKFLVPFDRNKDTL